MERRACPGCPGLIVKKPGPGRWPKFCSPECRGNSLRKKPVDYSDRPCEHCGCALPVSVLEIRYCNARCRNRAHYDRARADGRYEQWNSRAKDAYAQKNARPCPYCGERMPPRHRVACDSFECQSKARGERMRAYLAEKSAEFTARGESYRGQWSRIEYGSARRRTAVVGDIIDRRGLGDRDGWVCGLCSEPVDPDLAYPDPLSASIDHVVPLGPKYGGSHTWDNVQIAHNNCNVRKKDRLDWTPEVANAYTDAAAKSG